MSHGIFLDDDPQAVQDAEEAEAATRRLGISPHQYAVATIEFQGMAEAIVAKAIAFGQTRLGFLKSMAAAWDTYFSAYKLLRRVQEQADAAAGVPPPGHVKIEQKFDETDPERAAKAVAAGLEAHAVKTRIMCIRPDCQTKGEHTWHLLPNPEPTSK